ncbi:major histocompatibility complex class I-related gene protein-like isoform X1 [Clupea harengus]|uniref:Major histocompatibility complex class I-related gene protein-like isoform X1 n=1 Tax=Clupea harengus TaxID=7950 RepID=A0A6P8FJ60_CLUHA|nr:major histocompatibility complex class I-related gene protein-like isoform X1 [Clupea harengus]
MQAVLIVVCLPLSSTLIHSLRYFYTATSGISNFPEFVAVGMVDGLAISQYDSNTRIGVPRQAWMKENLDQDYWKSETEQARKAEKALKEDMGILKRRFNRTEGAHVLQRMYGCEWDDESDVTSGNEQYGYDGEDFFSLELNNMRWVAHQPQAVLTKDNWNTHESIYHGRKRYFTQDCRDWLKKYVQYGSSSRNRTVAPEVSLFQKKSSSTVVCHATGSYPDRVKITWRRDGWKIQEDVTIGETLPNGDGTFQKRAEIKVSPEERKRSQYTCEVEHMSGEPTLITLTEEDGNTLVSIIAGCVIAAVVLIGVVVAVVMMKKKKRDYKKAKLSNMESDTFIGTTKTLAW